MVWVRLPGRTQWQVAEGRDVDSDELATGRDVALLGSTLAQRLFGNADPVAKSSEHENAVVTVVGGTPSKGQTTSGKDQDDTIVVPLRTAKARVLGRGGVRWEAVDTALVKVDEQ